jgi:hypothetical protein
MSLGIASRERGMYNDVVWVIRKRKVMTHEETWAVPVGRWLALSPSDRQPVS